MARIAVISGKSTMGLVKKLGHKVVFIDDWCPLTLAMEADDLLEIDLEDWDAVAERLEALHNRNPIDAVITNKQPHVALAAYLADRLQVKGLSYEAALNCNVKGRMREVLNGAGISPVAYETVKNMEELMPLADKLPYPVVIKPTEGMGSQGVKYCGSAEEVIQAAGEIWAEEGTVDSPVVLEEYLDGMQMTVDAVIRDGQPEILAVLENSIGGFPHFITTGFEYPANISEDEMNDVVTTVKEALKKLGVNCGNAHCEVRLTDKGTRIIEVNPRAPGGRIREVVQAVTGVDLVTEGLASVMGDEVVREEPKAAVVAYRSLYVEESGELHFNEEALDESSFPQRNGLTPIVEVDADPGEYVYSISEEVGVLGRVVVFGNNKQELEEDMKLIFDKLDFHSEPAKGSIR